MKKILVGLLIATAAVFAVSLCGCQQASYGCTFTNGSFDVQGKVLTIRLDGNPTTGYEWTCNQAADALTLTSQDYESSGTGAESGAGGTYTFVFEGKGAGTSTLTFTYARSWESSPDDETVTVTVTTDSSGTVTSTEAVTKDGTSYGER